MFVRDFAEDLPRAIQQRQIRPFFQPIVDLNSGTVSSLEVLSRWQHPTIGLICPGKFIPLAERLGLIADLTHNVLIESAREAALWPAAARLSVNVSPLQLRDTTLPRQIADLAVSNGLPLERLTIEVTESALIDNLDTARDIAAELRSMSVQLALDDFGTGFSSLRHLQALPFSKLKIDASFVRSMLTRRENRKIVAAVIGLGKSLGIETIAEGVELAEQASMLAHLGCDCGQGWLYSRALPASEVPGLLSLRFPTSVPSHASDDDQSSDVSLEASPDHRLAHLRAIYTGAPIGLCLVNRDLRFVNVNQMLARHDGLHVADYIGRYVSDLVPDLAPVIVPALQRALRGEYVQALDLSWQQPVPPHQPVHAFAFYHPVRDEAREIVGVSVAVVYNN